MIVFEDSHVEYAVQTKQVRKDVEGWFEVMREKYDKGYALCTAYAKGYNAAKPDCARVIEISVTEEHRYYAPEDEE